MNTNEMIGLKLKALRESRRYSLEDLAKLVGKSRKTIFKYEQGDISISVDNLKSILVVYGITVGKFLDELEEGL